MPRLLGIDPGQRRTGIALSDPSGALARPLTVLEERGEELTDRIRGLVREYGVDRVVVGYPKPLRVEENERTRQVDAFLRDVLEPLDVPVVTVSERYTTRQAERLRRERGQPDEASDAEAAALILQRYLDEEASSSPGNAPR